MKRDWLLAAAMSACFSCAQAQPVAPTPPQALPLAAADTPATPPPSPSSALLLPANTPVRIELAEAVASNSRVRGDKFAIRLAAPIVIDGQTVAPKGATGMGEVVYAEGGSGGGAPGKLVLAARYIDVGSTRIRLKAFNLAAGGESNFRDLQIATQFLSIGVMLINGRDVLYPVGTRAGAKVAEAVSLPVLPLADTGASVQSSPAQAMTPAPVVSGPAAATPATTASKEP